MTEIGWKANLATGLAALDKDHQKMIELIKRTEEIAKVGGRREEIKEILSSLVDYTKSHMLREEKIMEDSGYKSIGPHRFEHAVFMRRIHEFIDRFESGENIVEEMASFLYTWLIDHINKTDKVMVWSLDYLNEQKQNPES